MVKLNSLNGMCTKFEQHLPVKTLGIFSVTKKGANDVPPLELHFR